MADAKDQKPSGDAPAAPAQGETPSITAGMNFALVKVRCFSIKKQLLFF